MIERKEINIKGLPVSFLESGDGPVQVAMMHGWRGDKNIWYPNILELSNRFHCAALDLPGFGETGTPKFAWNTSEYAHFLKNFTDQIGWKKPVIIGKSFGGRVAIRYAVEYPDSLSGLVLVSSAGTEQRSFVSKSIILLAKTGKHISKLLSLDSQEKLRTTFYRIFRIRDEDSQLKLITKKAVTQDDLTSLLGRINIPTLVVWGKNDNILPPYIGRKMHLGIKSSKYIEIEGGHDAHSENALEFNKIVEEFIDGLR